jgi:hypothetical protein
MVVGLLRVIDFVGRGFFDEIDRMLAIGSIHVALAAPGDFFAILRVVNPIPLTALIFFLPITGVCNFSHKCDVFWS